MALPIPSRLARRLKSNTYIYLVHNGVCVPAEKDMDPWLNRIADRLFGFGQQAETNKNKKKPSGIFEDPEAVCTWSPGSLVEGRPYSYPVPRIKLLAQYTKNPIDNVRPAYTAAQLFICRIILYLGNCPWPAVTQPTWT